MGWRFRKSVKIAPGTRLNFSRSGVSVTNRVGRTGIYHRTQLAGKERGGYSSSKKRKIRLVPLLLVVLVISLLLWAYDGLTGGREPDAGAPPAAATAAPDPTQRPAPVRTSEPTSDPLGDLRQDLAEVRELIE